MTSRGSVTYGPGPARGTQTVLVFAVQFDSAVGRSHASLHVVTSVFERMGMGQILALQYGLHLRASLLNWSKLSFPHTSPSAGHLSDLPQVPGIFGSTAASQFVAIEICA
jgi:hypothetical protein